MCSQSPSDEMTLIGFQHLRALTVRYFLNRFQSYAVETESQIAMFDWILLLLAYSTPESLAVLSSDRSGCNGDTLVSRFTDRTARELRCLRMPYLSCSAPVVRTLLAFCPSLKELSLAVTSAQSLVRPSSQSGAFADSRALLRQPSENHASCTHPLCTP
jgi:hypothetical protein